MRDKEFIVAVGTIEPSEMGPEGFMLYEAQTTQQLLCRELQEILKIARHLFPLLLLDACSSCFEWRKLLLGLFFWGRSTSTEGLL